MGWPGQRPADTPKRRLFRPDELIHGVYIQTQFPFETSSICGMETGVRINNPDEVDDINCQDCLTIMARVGRFT